MSQAGRGESLFGVGDEHVRVSRGAITREHVKQAMPVKAGAPESRSRFDPDGRWSVGKGDGFCTSRMEVEANANSAGVGGACRVVV